VPQPVAERQRSVSIDPDAQRRFRVMANVEELERALDFPWEKWTIFLHPEQRQWVERDYTGPARVSGSAGTGKTIVALHRAVHLARTHPDARVLLTPSDTLANALHTKLKRCWAASRLGEGSMFTHSTPSVRLYKAHSGNTIASPGSARTDERGRERRGRHKFGCISAHRMGAGGGCVAVETWRRIAMSRLEEDAARRRSARSCGPSRACSCGLQARNSSRTRACSVIGCLGKSKKLVLTRGRRRRRTSASPIFVSAALGEAERLFADQASSNSLSWKAWAWTSGTFPHLRVNYRTSHQIRTQGTACLAA
jgi:hypothetical protein